MEKNRAIDPSLPDVEYNAGPLRYKTARAALASGSADIFTRLLTVALSVATARALDPREVGVLGIAVIGVGIISMLGYYSVTAAVVARDEGGDGMHAIVALVIRGLTISSLVILAVVALPMMVGYFAGGGQEAGQLRAVLAVLIWYPFIELAGSYPQVVLQRRLDLNFLALTQILQPVIFVGLALFLLVEGYGAVGVAWANVAATVVVVLVVWLRLWLQGLPRWHGWPSLSIWREAMAGSFKMFVGGFGGYLGGRIDNLVVTAAIGPLAMSFYSMAWNASRMPANVFASAINFVFIPTLARIQGDPERVDRGFRECLKHSYLLLAPVCAVLFVSSPLIVTFVLGAKWLPLIPALRVMCFTVLFGPLIFACGALLTGTGRAHLVGIATIVQIVVLLVSIPFLANRWGVVGAAYGDLLAVVALTVVLCATVKVVTRQLNRALFATFTVPVVAAISGGLAAWNLGAHISTDALRLIVECVLTLTVYLLVVLVLGGRARLFDLTTLLRGIVRRSPLVSAQ